jgi:hypothetical protein
MKIVVGAAMSVPPFAPGMTWDRLHYVLGFLGLGHEAYFVKEVKPKSCVDGSGRPCAYPDSKNAEHFRCTMQQFHLLERSSQIFNGGEATTGMDLPSLTAAIRGADLLLNISGHVRLSAVVESVRRRAYLEQDPVYTQLWHAEYGADIGLEWHDVLFSVGLNIGTPQSPVPDCGRDWHPSPSLVDVDRWPPRIDPRSRRFTTVATWGRYADLSCAGRAYSSKREQFRRFAGLARHTRQPLEVALPTHDLNDPDAVRLRHAGWIVTDASRLADLRGYQRFIATSRAEIGIAKGAYVTGRSGWIGDRTCHFLASAKPVLAESTGAEHHVPTGAGLVTFSDMEEAVAGIEEINRDYEYHSRAARRLAEQHCDYRRVLPPMIEKATS